MTSASNDFADSVSKPTLAELRNYYASLPREYGFDSQCRMEILGEVRGKRILDVDCRRGKGVVKLSDWVGQWGFVLGVDPNPDFISTACSFVDSAWRKNGLIHSNMDYRVAYAEALKECGISQGRFDIVYTNSSLALAYNASLAIREMHQTLRPGGMLVYDGVVAQDDRDAGVVAQARKIGNTVQSAFSCDDLARFARDAGFDAPEYHDISVVDPETGFNDRYEVPIVTTNEHVTFLKVTALLYKPRR